MRRHALDDQLPHLLGASVVPHDRDGLPLHEDVAADQTFEGLDWRAVQAEDELALVGGGRGGGRDRLAQGREDSTPGSRPLGARRQRLRRSPPHPPPAAGAAPRVHMEMAVWRWRGSCEKENVGTEHTKVPSPVFRALRFGGKTVSGMSPPPAPRAQFIERHPSREHSTRRLLASKHVDWGRGGSRRDLAFGVVCPRSSFGLLRRRSSRGGFPRGRRPRETSSRPRAGPAAYPSPISPLGLCGLCRRALARRHRGGPSPPGCCS